MNLSFEIPLESFVKIFSQMNHLEYKNFVRHSLQVAKMTRHLAETLGLNVCLDHVYFLGMLHDIGLVIKASLENYELFVDMFRRVPDLERLVLTFDKEDKHPAISYRISSMVMGTSHPWTKSVLYHHTPYQKINESDETTVLIANCLRTADLISLINLKHSEGELDLDLLNGMIHVVERDPGILETVRGAAIQMLKDYRSLYELLDDEPRFSSSRRLSLLEFEKAARVVAALLDLRSPYTRHHTFLVSDVSRVLALELMSEEDSNVLAIAALLHDLGKFKTPLSILHKKGKLDEREWLIMRRHVVDTYVILERANLVNLARIAASHHERLDGSGYPTGLKANQTTMYQRIIQVSDVFSALLEQRPYRESLKPEQALSVVEREVNSGRLDGVVYGKLKEIVKNKYFEKSLSFRDVLSHLLGGEELSFFGWEG